MATRDIRLRDTLSGELSRLEPREPGHVGIYACGPTVYAPIHVGNARPFVVFTLLGRFLALEGYSVTFVVNVTDVNDKIYDAARRQGVPSAELARTMTERYMQDTDRLGLGRPDHEPLASESIEGIVELIAALIERGSAYEAAGDVYFRVSSYPAYGKLSNRPLDQMRQGEDDEDRPGLKESARDFALWKAQKPGEDTAWDSPWGAGRPGWHIECSAMAEQELGLDFEVHGGGTDLVFPHHENEIAQTEAGRGRPLARIWMHNGMVQSGQDKMSKSEGDPFLLHQALDEVGRDALLIYYAAGHYRQPLAWSRDALQAAARTAEGLRDFCRRLDPVEPAPVGLDPHADAFFDALADDFNTPRALAQLFRWVSEGNRRVAAGERLGIGRLAQMLHALGLDGLLKDAGSDRSAALPAEVEALLADREAARSARDFAAADALRDELAAVGWVVRDTPRGQQVVRAT